MEGEDRYIEDTQAFVDQLREIGYDIFFLHGPVGLHEDVILAAVSFNFSKDEHPLQTFCDLNDTDYIYFIYQMRWDEGRLRYAKVSNKDWVTISTICILMFKPKCLHQP